MTAHIESSKDDIAKRVLMPGDPLRAKYIANKFLEDARCINQTRGMLGFTGKYKGEDVTIFASGMGGPSIGIYAYELYHFYDVDKIIRIGTCGSNKESVKVRDLVIGDDGARVEKGTIMTSDIFDGYVDKDRYMKNYDSRIDTLVSEMEGAILYCISKHLNKQAACILTVVDSMYEKIELSSHDREQALDQMITVALDTVIE